VSAEREFDPLDIVEMMRRDVARQAPATPRHLLILEALETALAWSIGLAIVLAFIAAGLWYGGALT
jgi:hypothetical protein